MADSLRVSNSTEFREHKTTFDHFLAFSLWGTLLIIMSVAMFTVAFAMGLGWMTGVGVFLGIGVLAGLALGMGGAWWALVIITSILLALGGLVTLFFQ
jgi:Bacterial aa3 type cytochrome c oxidase subunit IV